MAKPKMSIKLSVHESNLCREERYMPPSSPSPAARLQAIKAYRTRTHATLADAKAAIDAFCNRDGLPGSNRLASHPVQDMKTVAATGKLMLVTEHPGIVALRRALKSERWDDQGGYPGYVGNGKWDFASSPVGPFTPDEVNALFDLAGLVPDAIQPKGSCEDCAHAAPSNQRPGGFITYHERGYSVPCSPCKRPLMSNFKPRKKTPANRRFGCLYCGGLFKYRQDRDTHYATRNAVAGHICPPVPKETP